MSEQPGFSESNSQKNIHQYQKFPFEDLAKQGAQSFVDLLGNIGQRFEGPQQPGTGADGSPIPGGGSGSDFQGYYNNIGGPPVSITDYQKGDFYSPQRFAEEQNAIAGQSDRLTAENIYGAGQKTPYGQASGDALQERLASYKMAGDQTRQQGLNDHRSKFQQGASNYDLQAGQLLNNAEAQRAAENQGRRQLALTGRGQDFQREQNLLAALLGAAGGGAGLLSPFTYYDDTSKSNSFSVGGYDDGGTPANG